MAANAHAGRSPSGHNFNTAHVHPLATQILNQYPFVIPAKDLRSRSSDVADIAAVSMQAQRGFSSIAAGPT